jgi:hypothetical protein
MLKALLLAACLAGGIGIAEVLAQDPFVIVPDFPSGGGSGSGGGAGNALATTNLNVRSGPATRYPVIDVLQRGETVRVSTCDGGWCRVNRAGIVGWASQRYLDRTGASSGVRPARGACFYAQPRFQGGSFCAEPGDSNRNLGSWNNLISSISIRGFATVQVCSEPNFNDCDAFNRDTPTLPWWLKSNVSSYRVLH